MEYAIQTEGLCKQYRGKYAVDHLDMRVPEGEIYGFIGSNGAGKSTTFKLIAGLAGATAGTIRLFGRPLEDKTVRHQIGVLIEEAGLYPGLTARENCKLKARLLGLTREDQTIGTVLQQVGLTQTGDKAVKHFSMGQRRRLGLAMALLGSPDLLLLDEPTNGLDPEGIRDIRTLLVRMQQERGVTIVVSSHILGELEKIATCYGILREGRMVREVSARELATQCSDYLVLRTTESARAAALLEEKLGVYQYENLPGGELHLFDAPDSAVVAAVLAGAGIPIQFIGNHRQRLEDYFLQMMGEGHHV